MIQKTKLAGLLAAMTVSFGAQAAGVIDLFTTGQLLAKDFSDGGFNATDSNFSQAGGLADASIVGGFRDLVVSNLTGGIAGVQGSSINVAASKLIFSTDAGATGQGQVQWDGDDSAGSVFDIAFTGLGGIDITAGGSLTAFQLVTEFSDQGWVFELAMYTNATTWTKVSVDANSVGPAAPPADFVGPHTSFIPFAAFGNPLFCGTYGAAPGVNAITCGPDGNANPFSVGALVATLNVGDPLAPDGTGSAPQARTISVDLQLSSVTTVPEPSILALVGVGLLGMGAARKRALRQG